MKRIALLLSLLVSIGIAVFYFRLQRLRFDADAPPACQHIGICVMMWHEQFLEHSKQEQLPYAYPHSLNDLIVHGILQKKAFDYWTDHLKLEYFIPPDNAESNFVVIRASTPRVSYVGYIGGSTDIASKAEQDAAANP